MTEPNVALLRQTLDYIEDHPLDWDQARWHCGTVCCFAGRAALLNGAEWAQIHGMSATRSVAVVARDDDPAGHVRESDGCRFVHVEVRAARVLGLTLEQAQDLFDPANSLDDLRELVKILTGGAA